MHNGAVVIETAQLTEGLHRLTGWTLQRTSFMRAPDPAARMPAALSVDAPPAQMAQRAAGGARRPSAPGPGGAVLPWSEDGLNSSNSLHDAFLVMAAEEMVLSLAPGDTLCALGLRYLQTVRADPVAATARVRGRPAQVALHDSGNGHRRSVLAVAGTSGAGDPGRGVE
jgi:hypothetical protein